MSGNKNILMISWDSVRADHIPFHGYGRDTTSHISKIANEGLVFDNTQVSAVGTAASFTGIFTGDHAAASMLNPSPEYWEKSLENERFLQEVLQENGYHTGGLWEAYKHTEDPMEKNRWGEHPEELETKLREQLQSRIEDVDSGNNMDSATKDRLRELGYIE